MARGVVKPEAKMKVLNLLAMGYFAQPSDLEWFNALLQFPTRIGEINTELLHKQTP